MNSPGIKFKKKTSEEKNDCKYNGLLFIKHFFLIRYRALTESLCP